MITKECLGKERGRYVVLYSAVPRRLTSFFSITYVIAVR